MRNSGARIVLIAAAAGAGAAAPAAAQHCGTWREAIEPAMMPRLEAAAGWDSRRGVGVLYGGRWNHPGGGTHYVEDLWEWSGGVWTRARLTNLPPMTDHAMAFDPGRGLMLIHGTATFEYDGISLMRRGGVPSDTIYGAALAYDAARGHVILFGGNGSLNEPSNETYRFDPALGGWVRFSPLLRPAGRYDHAMAYDPDRQVVVLFGGNRPGTSYGDTWEWNGQEWDLRAVSGPAPGGGGTMAWDSVRRTIVLFMGSSLWGWDGAAWQRLAPPTFVPGRTDQAGFFDESRDSLVIHGGASTYTRDGTWEFTAAGAWQNTIPYDLEPRAYAEMVFDPMRHETILYGGTNFNRQECRGTYLWDGVRWTRRDTDGPRARHGFGLVFDSARSRAVLFGGGDQFGSVAETWSWDGAAWSMLSLGARTFEREAVGMAYDAARDRIVMYGGAFDNEINYVYKDDTWEFDGQSWRQIAVSGPGPRAHHGMAYDLDRGVVVLFGGAVNAQQRAETWEYDGAAWALRPTTVNPGAERGRWGAKMVWDPDRRTVVLHGGSDDERGDTWEWNGEVWSERSESFPERNSHFALAYDASRHTLVRYGGREGNDSTSGRTWILPACVPSCYADCDPSGVPQVLDVFDFLCFQNRFAQNDPYACDCDTSTGPGVCDIFDLTCFQDAFAAGCP